ncbi:histidine--tRNA ligase [Aureibacter tunicatorum]|uniref:Histidine--tRNA ligase n=1 Tax=Aureibacter tunicatorum TaxID=866807 RepID=A0AAE3XLL1_9BACT|nr:histidine--tRNA ligase [Aureibacter tunicatorum]MDR6238185.1 histidyl-tRNA synthetase [Aureibacter tunicatorum]BDD03218.1 histidine--tRNA ligase [Aureibacter tunicatorum]
MAKQKPSIPKGTRDFGPDKMVRRNYIFNTIRSVFEKFGFLPLETPTMENLSVLTGKYGDEGDQLLFKILNSGDFTEDATHQDFDKGHKHLTPIIAKKGLRYDLTVPFARYVVMNRNDIAFPFKRYQIQPVWRADKPQKGRYREFYQCDADVVGTNSLLCEAEIVMMINEVFGKFKLNDYDIKINNRKILTGITEAIGAEGRESDFCVAIDKLDKIGQEKVLNELRQKGFSDEAVDKTKPVLEFKGNLEETIAFLKELFGANSETPTSSTGIKGIEELEEVFNYLSAYGHSPEELNVDFDITLARGLSYYTGAIFEVKVNNVEIGSVSGGGRYDNLTGVFGLDGTSGVGFSFGVDRIYDVLEALDLFPVENLVSTQVMIVQFDKQAGLHAVGLVKKLREAEIKSELYPEANKLKKQMTYANKKNIPFVILVGSNEIESQRYALKNMAEGNQEELTIDEIIDKLSKQ